MSAATLRSFRAVDMSGRYTRHATIIFSQTHQPGDGIWMNLTGDALRSFDRHPSKATPMTPPVTKAVSEFPILEGWGDRKRNNWRKSVPWSLVEPHRRQATLNHYQTLERLAERGGLSPCELIAVIEDRAWTAVPEADARAMVDKAVATHIATAIRATVGEVGK